MSKHILQTLVNFELMPFHINLFQFNFCGEDEETVRQEQKKMFIDGNELYYPFKVSLCTPDLTFINFSYCPQN